MRAGSRRSLLVLALAAVSLALSVTSYLDELPLDPWGHPYQYRRDANPRRLAFSITSFGADGATGGTGGDADIALHRPLRAEPRPTPDSPANDSSTAAAGR